MMPSLSNTRRLLCVFALLFLASSVQGAKESSTTATKEPEKTPPPPKEAPKKPAATMFVDVSKLEVVDLLRSGALVVGFAAAFFADKKGESRNFQLAHSIFLGLYGLAMFFFPALVLGYQTVGSLDQVHIYAAQMGGCLFVGMAVMLHRQYHANSKDTQVTASWLIGTVFGGALLLEMQLYSQFTLKAASHRFNDQHVTFTMLGNVLVLVGGFYKLWEHFNNNGGSSRVTRSRSVSNDLNSNVLISVLLIFPGTMMLLFAPQFTYDLFMESAKLDGVHLHMLRVIGCMNFVVCLLLILSLQYESDSDRRDLLIGLFVTMCMSGTLMGLCQYKSHLYSTKQFGFQLGMNGLFLGNLAYACFCRGKDKQY